MFEVITKEQYSESTTLESVPTSLTAGGADVDSDRGETEKLPAVQSPLVYCKFCKGYYYEEYHYGDRS